MHVFASFERTVFGERGVLGEFWDVGLSYLTGVPQGKSGGNGDATPPFPTKWKLTTAWRQTFRAIISHAEMHGSGN